jgi:hypothetical protein
MRYKVGFAHRGGQRKRAAERAEAGRGAVGDRPPASRSQPGPYPNTGFVVPP